MAQCKHSNNLKHLRQLLGMTQQALADSLGEKQTKIKDIETDKQKISIDLALKVENIHHVNFRWLLTGEGEPFKTEQIPDNTVILPIRGNVEASMGYGVAVYDESPTAT